MSNDTGAALAVMDSITQLKPEDAGQVVVAGSHGGVYAAYLAAKGKVAAVILNDAGNGLDDAGIAVLHYFDEIGGAAAVVGHMTARIGDGADMMASGTITGANEEAVRLGCRVGQPCAEAAEALKAAKPSTKPFAEHSESRFLLVEGPVPVWGIDSATLVRPADAGTIVIAGSHGATRSADPFAALRVDALAAAFHDAGMGKDNAGITRLPALDTRGIGAVTIAGDSARIGDCRSMWETGVVSALNATAKAWGVEVLMSLQEFADLAAARARKQG